MGLKKKSRKPEGMSAASNKSCQGLTEDQTFILTSIVESSDDAIITKTSTGIITFWNETAEKIYGYSAREAVGKPISILLPPGNVDDMPGILGRISQGESIHHYETVRRRKDGRLIHVSVSTSPIKDKNGRIIGASTIARDITANVLERKRADENLAAASQYARSLIESSLDPLVTISADGKITDVNEATVKVTGVSRDQLIGTDFSNYFTEPAKAREGYRQVFAEGFVTDYPLTIRHQNGQLTDVLYNASVYKDTRGNVLGVFAAARDVTVQKQAFQYARSLIESSLDPLVTISTDGKITDVNEATVKVTGVPRDQLIGTDFSNYFTEPAKAREGYQQVFANGFVTDYPLTIRHKDGWTTDVLYNASVYKDTRGKVLGVFAAARDVTARKKAEEERLRLVAAVEQAEEGIAITDAVGRIDYANPAFEKTSGRKGKDLRGTSYYTLLIGETSYERSRKIIQDMVLGGEAWTGQLKRKCGDSLERELQVSFTPIRDQSGAVTNFLAVERDVTTETRLQQNLRQLQKLEALGTLAGGIAHDFNNLLNPILINTELALLDAPRDDPIRQYLQLVLQAAERGKELIKQIITFSRQKEKERKPLKVEPLVKEALKFLRSSLPRTIEIRENIQREASYILADPTQIHQVVLNLCNNSAYAMREHGGVLEVGLAEVDADMSLLRPGLNPGRYLRLTVADTGTGMTQEVMERAFDPFFTTKKPGEGSGLGLPMVNGIVNDHGGSITLYSEVGKGSTFNIYFPLVKAEGLALDVMNAPLALAEGHKRILFVDDEEVQVRSIQRMMERLGYEVVTETDSKKALALFLMDPQAFDLVITDQTMPQMTGIELAEELLRIRPNLPIVLCTGFSELVDANGAQEKGIFRFLMKPFSIREMGETVRQALGKK